MCDHLTLKDQSEGLKLSVWNNKENKNEEQSEASSVKWMPSKLRMMRKMISTSEGSGVDHRSLNSAQKFDDQKRQMPPSEADNSSSNNSLNINSNTIVRVCADCNTTKTPLWRSGPRGPKVYMFLR